MYIKDYYKRKNIYIYIYNSFSQMLNRNTLYIFIFYIICYILYIIYYRIQYWKI
jgi:hypothetical protein